MTENHATSEAVIGAIRRVVGEGGASLHEPSFIGREWEYVKRCLDSTFVSSVGEFVNQFECDLAKFTGAKHAVAVMNGTAALHIALKLAGVREGDEVFVPSLTFVATANAVVYCGASPHFVASESTSYGICPDRLREYLISSTDNISGQTVNRTTGHVIKAIVPMHVFGHPSDMDKLLTVAKDFNLVVIEDAAESLGSYYYGSHTGTLGLMGVLSFNGNKTITTGGGGAILTNDSDLAKLAKHLTTTAKIPHSWNFSHDLIGYNYRLPNLNAALGCAQLEMLPQLLKAKKALFLRYEKEFANVPNVQIVSEPMGCISNYWLQTIELADSISSERDQILGETNKAGLMTRPAWGLLHTLPPYKHFPRMSMSETEIIASKLINIPSSAHLGM